MKITFLGTAAGAPSRNRNVSAIALQFVQQSVLWLFDCGEGTQQQIIRSSVKLSQLERVFITHLHGDHLYGLPGMLASRSLQQNTVKPVVVYGPPGIEEYVETCFRVSGIQLSYPVTVITISPGTVYEDETISVECIPLEHRIQAFGFAVIEKPQPGRFNVKEAVALGVPAGPLYGRLKNGETITLDDGREIDGAKLVGPARKGRKIVYCSDTVYCQNAIDLAREADVLIHEATFAHSDLEVAIRSGHTTALQAGQVALAAKVQTLIITHFSVRYEAKGEIGIEGLLNETKSVFPNSLAADDFWSHMVEHPADADVILPEPVAALS